MKLKSTLLVLFFISTTAYAEDQKFIEFAVKQAHGQGFNSCDAAIRKVHEYAGGTDIRVNVTTHNDNPNQLTMVSTWGSKGDSVFTSATFINIGKQCKYDATAVVHTTKSCMAYSQEMSLFSYVAETGDYVWMKNKGGVNMLLHPAGQGCTAIFSFDQKA
ncbi:TPA: hypothetical protein I7217_22320 [Vibrio vulnificus]|uniref:hypothetical protein n=1 Tax=Vibrio vulnificus TaxID=672 RepID=UPI001A2519D2|nr:hypothetical protein [Vibrio vulnificus]EHU9460318.1 hypothetical protein [Vibrio vulnificus]MCU8247196.1 hypothetical protein [Vibrio vulnificus]WIL72891.1 hypothetical protein QPX65_07780 [Vibrio vulnificus]HAS6046258.1 hypothetical protein [Vibrio vulnificus]HAT8507103.1 hypothetical protein [Vibrio vulnificus]